MGVWFNLLAILAILATMVAAEESHDFTLATFNQNSKEESKTNLTMDEAIDSNSSHNSGSSDGGSEIHHPGFLHGFLESLSVILVSEVNNYFHFNLEIYVTSTFYKKKIL